MSITKQTVFAPCPTTIRARPTQLSADPKGERIAYASNKSIFLRSIDTPSLCTQYVGHTQPTTVARFSPSGYYVASGDASGVVRVWDCLGEDNVLKGEFPIISGRINDLAWDGESKRIIAVGEGRERYGHCITFDTGNSVGEIAGHSAPINSVSIRPIRPYRAATASDDRSLVFYHGAPFKFNSQLRDNHSNFVQSVAFSPNGEYLASVGADRKIFLYDGKTGELKSQIGGDDGHKGGVLGISWSADSKRFVTASADQTVKLWDLEIQKPAHTWKFGPASIQKQQLGIVWPNRSDGTIISLSLPGDLNYLREESERPYRIVTGHQKSITAMAVALKGKTFFTGSYEGRVCAWDIEKGEATVPEGESHSNQISGMENVSGRVISVGWDDKVRMADVGASIFVPFSIDLDGQPKGISAIGKNDEVVVVTTENIEVYRDHAKVCSAPVKGYNPTAISASADLNDIAVGAQDNSIYIYAYSNGSISECTIIKSNRSPISSLAYSSTGNLLAAGDSAGKITLYSRLSSSEYTVQTTRWSFHTGKVNSIKWNEENSHVVSGGLDTNIYIYSVADPGKNIKVLRAHKDGVNAVGWLAADRIVSAGSDGAVKIWSVKLT